MNIFVLDKNPTIAAQHHCDKHVVKMILETAQIMSAVAHKQGYTAPYRLTHKNHPCTLWAGENASNWEWLAQLGFALGREYQARYGKIHKSVAVIQWCYDNVKSLPTGSRTPFAQAMPDEYRHSDPVRAYRAYYKGEKAYMATWKTAPPSWWE